MDPYEYHRHVDEIARQVTEHQKHGTTPLCSLITLVDVGPGVTAQGVEHVLRERLSALGVYVTARPIGGRAAFECEIEGAPAVLFGLITDGFLNGGFYVKLVESKKS